MWSSFITLVLFERLHQLKCRILKLKEQGKSLSGHPDVVLFYSVVKAIEEARKDPTKNIYLLGNTLGPEFRDWRRIKQGMPARYRLFFKFFSLNKKIFFVWLNDEYTLRKEGAKTDVYMQFKQKLLRNEIASDIIGLERQSKPYSDNQE